MGPAMTGIHVEVQISGIHDAAPGTGCKLVPTSGAATRFEAATAKEIFLVNLFRQKFEDKSSQGKTGIKKSKQVG